MEASEPDIMTQRAEIAQQLEGSTFRTRDGKLNVPKLMEEVYIQTVIHNRKLDEGQKTMKRCKVLKGEMTFEEAHYLLPDTPPKRKKKLEDPGAPKADEVQFTGKAKMKTLIMIIIVIAAIAVPGGVAAMVFKIGGLP